MFSGVGVIADMKEKLAEKASKFKYVGFFSEFETNLLSST